LKKFLYFLTEKDGRSRTIINGVVTSTSAPTPLAQAPDGNQEISIGWERSPVYWGNIRNFSLQLGFVMDGAKILRNDWYKFNNDREIFLLVKRLTYEWTDATFKEYYKQLYKGQLDFATSSDDQGGYRYNIGIMEGGTQRQLKAAEGTTYEIPFDTDAKNVAMDGMFLKGVYKWFIPPFEYPVPGGYDEGAPGLFLTTQENRIPGLAILSTSVDISGAPLNVDNPNFFAEAAQDIAGVHLTGLFVNITPSTIPAAGTVSIILSAFNTVTNTIRFQLDMATGDPYAIGANIPIDETFDMVAGDRLFLNYGTIAVLGESTMELTALSKPLPSTIRGFTVYDLGRKLVEKMTGNADNFQSTVLQTLGVILTSGDGVRGLANAAIKTSWRDYFKFVDSLIMAEMTIVNGVITVEGRATAYVPTGAVPLGEIKALKVLAAVDLLATRIRVGHAEQEVDDLNGKFDFNGYQIWNTPLKAIPEKEYDIQHSYKASPYEIEHTRTNYDQKTTTDKSTDNDVFALAVVPDPAGNTFTTSAVIRADGAPFTPGAPLLSITAPVPLIRAGMVIRVSGSTLNNGDYSVVGSGTWFFGQLIALGESVVDEDPVAPITIEILEGQYYSLDRSIPITQLTDPDVDADLKESVFNVPLTPKRMLLNHAGWIAGICHNYAPASVTFVSANRNKDLIAGGIAEKADVPVADLGAPLFLPYYFEFDTISPVDMVSALEANPNPVFSFIWKGVTYTGFLISAGIALNDLDEQTFKLLAAPDNNLISLI